MSSLQEQIDQTPPNGILNLDPPNGEFQGPVVFRQKIRVMGQNSTIWAAAGPVVQIEASQVILENLNVEITGKEDQLSGEEAVALAVKPGHPPTLRDVSIRGNVSGLDTESGQWHYPNILRLKTLVCSRRHDFLFRIVTPVDCEVYS
ncbi:MAG: hypothetical protein KDA84_00450, partial [Planctomycetaceae bacterium]|nr:hypothetical protein [Planctomycetaceae bacterium]